MTIPVSFREEPFSVAYEEAALLVRMHYQEIAWRQDKIPLDVDVEGYKRLDAQGMLATYTARLPPSLQQELVGYSVWFLNRPLHYRSTLIAINDVVFVDERYRGTTGLRFARWCEEQLVARGVKVIHYHIKDAHDWSPALARLGYERVESHWQKWVGG